MNGETQFGHSAQRWLVRLARRAPCDAYGQARIGRRHIYILPTGFGVLLGGVLLLMLLGSLNYQNNLALLFTFLIGSVSLVAMHHTWFNLLGLQLGGRGGSPVFAGQDATYSITLSNDRRQRKPDLVVRENGKGTDPVALDPGGATAVSIRVKTKQRGVQKLDLIQVHTSYPLGLFRAWCYARTDAIVIVYPKPAAHTPAPSQVPTYSSSTAGDLGVGADEFVGLRSYRPGDSPRRVDWKALARERGLVVKMFGGDLATRIWLDWELLPKVDSELRLSLLCRQVLDAAEEGLTYGLRLPNNEIAMGHGDAHKHNCLMALATFDLE